MGRKGKEKAEMVLFLFGYGWGLGMYMFVYREPFYAVVTEATRSIEGETGERRRGGDIPDISLSSEVLGLPRKEEGKGASEARSLAALFVLSRLYIELYQGPNISTELPTFRFANFPLSIFSHDATAKKKKIRKERDMP